MSLCVNIHSGALATALDPQPKEPRLDLRAAVLNLQKLLLFHIASVYSVVCMSTWLEKLVDIYIQIDIMH